LVDNVSKINSGIWRAALVGYNYLSKKAIKSILVSTTSITVVDSQWIKSLELRIELRECSTFNEVMKLLDSVGAFHDNSIIVSHGAWKRPTRFAHKLKCKGFRWIYVPHGMLEPWSLRQGATKKKVYYQLFEGRMVKKADYVRAVSSQEQINLRQKVAAQLALIHNGIQIPLLPLKDNHPITFLFMARLHHKKGIFQLVCAWAKMMYQSSARLVIAGPDEGELEKIKPFLKENIEYRGGVYDADKEALLRASHYYILPSYSEGFPTSVLEAMSFGLIPLISQGCNFPEVFTNDLGFKVEPNVESIAIQLARIGELPFDQKLSRKNHEFVATHYSEDVIGKKLFNLYKEVLRPAQQTN
jgi:glycosyltransferase involved in cell wall biosynthesis